MFICSYGFHSYYTNTINPGMDLFIWTKSCNPLGFKNTLLIFVFAFIIYLKIVSFFNLLFKVMLSKDYHNFNGQSYNYQQDCDVSAVFFFLVFP